MADASPSGPGVITRVELAPRAPTPADCFPPGVEPAATADLAPGWIAVTERELVSYHPDRDPAVVRTDRHNVTGVVLRRAGGLGLVRYVPAAILVAVVSASVGAVMVAVDPTGVLVVPEGTAGAQIATIVDSLAQAMIALGALLLFVGILAGFLVAAVLLAWLCSRDMVLEIERGDADPVRCPTSRATGTRVVGLLEESLVDRGR